MEKLPSPSASRKRRRPAWKDQPAFLDASASISAATFGARRLPELEQLYQRSSIPGTEIVAQDVPFESGGGKTSSRHLRRRTTSHNSRKHRHRFPNGKSTTCSPKEDPKTRKAKRSRPSILAQGHYEWQQNKITDTSATSVQWLATHIWHAKRCHMETLWGWRVPVMHTNRGGRAALRLSLTHTLLQDVTWERRPVGVYDWSSTFPKLGDIQNIFSPVLPNWLTDRKLIQQFLEHDGEGGLAGESILYEMGQFPQGAIGPVWWRISKNLLEITAPPAIQKAAIETLQALQRQQPLVLQQPNTKTLGFSNSICVFRLSGKGVIQALNKSIRCAPQQVNLSHGTTITLRTKFDEAAKDTVGLTLVRVQPRPLDCPPNISLAGWEVYCSSNHASEVWNALSMQCVVIGLKEQSHLQLECEPPVPLFPRDFVDCPASAEYWAAWSPSTHRDDEVSSSSRVRHLFEGDWGRIRHKDDTKALPSLPWSELTQAALSSKLDADDDATDTEALDEGDLVMVRGDFGEPFLAVVNRCGQASYDNLNTAEDVTGDAPNHFKSNKRRKHRRAKPGNTATQIQPLSKGQIEEWRAMTKALYSNLSLPAVLQAHVVLTGEGKLDVGDPILVGSIKLGSVTAASFSPSRGQCHGLAILGAARLLDELSSMQAPSVAGRIVRLLNGRQQVCLSVNSSSSGRGNGSKKAATARFIL